jgi:hypothetical protein
MRLPMRFVVVVLGSALACGCAHSLPHPPYSAQPTSALVEVTRPFPPARVEVVPAQPHEGATWIDGEWIWRRGRWAWLAGRWVMAPAGETFSPPVFVRGPDGRLWYAPGEWRDERQAVVDPPAPLVIASVEAGVVVNADGRPEPTGPILHDRPHDSAETDKPAGTSPPPSEPPRGP